MDISQLGNPKLLQKLWKSYGEICSLTILQKQEEEEEKQEEEIKVVVKIINCPRSVASPSSSSSSSSSQSSSDVSHERKVHSYLVEFDFYRFCVEKLFELHSDYFTRRCPLARCLVDLSAASSSSSSPPKIETLPSPITPLGGVLSAVTRNQDDKLEEEEEEESITKQSEENDENNNKFLLHLVLLDLRTRFPNQQDRNAEEKDARAVSCVLKFLARWHAFTATRGDGEKHFLWEEEDQEEENEDRETEKQVSSSSSSKQLLPLFQEHLHDRGSYWHLATRREEFSKMTQQDHGVLKEKAEEFDEEILSSKSKFVCLLHGDPKFENFLLPSFSPQKGEREQEHVAAAVDFQYVGFGVGVVDLACFLRYCDEEKVHSHIQEYFTYLQEAFDSLLLLSNSNSGSSAAVKELIEEWKRLLPVAVADFARFYCSWKPAKFSELPKWQREMIEENFS